MPNIKKYGKGEYILLSFFLALISGLFTLQTVTSSPLCCCEISVSNALIKETGHALILSFQCGAGQLAISLVVRNCREEKAVNFRHWKSRLR